MGSGSGAKGIGGAGFASAAKDAARKVGPQGRFGTSKVYISDAYDQFHKTAAGRRVTLDQYKARLTEAMTGRKLNLSRADLVEAMDAGKLKASHTRGPGGSEFHFLRLD